MTTGSATKTRARRSCWRTSAAELGLGCDIIPKVEVAGITVSSTYIRRLLELGQVRPRQPLPGPSLTR